MSASKRRRLIVLIGAPGTGKTHLATAAARQARMANRLASAELVILAELGYLPCSQAGGALLFQLISLLYEHQYCHHHQAELLCMAAGLW